MRLVTLLLSFILVTYSSCQSQTPAVQQDKSSKAIQVGAASMQEYLLILKDKDVALVVNHTSLVDSTHLVDTLLAVGIRVKQIFAPEHGFRGDAANGETVKDAVDTKTGLPIISLYGKNKKPYPEQLQDIDVMVFDIQDVGARFYTYISTMHYVMEACAEQNKPLLILDRPNPNGYYVDGPVLNMELSSFVGMHPIPIVHGLTVGELAQMINGEDWLKDGAQCKITIIKAKNYTHLDHYSLPVRPSPNLPNDQSVNLYPSLCLFEGTVMSLGRGTPYPFQIVGYPDPTFKTVVPSTDTITFVPENIPGIAMNPPQEGKQCYGSDFRHTDRLGQISLNHLIAFYKTSQKAGIPEFFNNFFDKLAGTKQLKKQITANTSEAGIRASWAEDLRKYKSMRKEYLLYEDFE